MISLLIYVLIILTFTGIIPIIVLLAQFNIAGLHGIFNHYAKCEPYLPRVAILVPSWNEAEALAFNLDRLMQIDYPIDSLRIYVIDDASTDNTPEIIEKKQAEYPNRIFHIRREKGGEGKAHTLNAGLKKVLSEDWSQAIMIIDADVAFEKNTLLKMTRHLADPAVGAVTAYIKVGYFKDNFITHSIAAEYILSQAIARRAQNVTRALACLAGGAQLHSRANIEAMGGQINTSTLAEDTYTTFLTQVNNRRAIFEGNSIVQAEEPDNLIAFWKQRFRWSRGNVQISKAFKHLWFRRKHTSQLGGIFFGLTWFSTLMMPLAMIITSFSLVALFFIDPARSWALMRIFYILSTTSYVFATLLSCAIDPVTMRRAWFSALLFPGVISLCMMVISLFPNFFDAMAGGTISYSYTWRDYLLLFMDAWVSLCMLCAWIIFRLARLGVSEKIINVLLMIVGYGPLLCTITLLAFIAEFKQSNITWDKTEKHLLTKEKKVPPYVPMTFEQSLQKDIKAEHRLLRDELLIIIFMLGCYAFSSPSTLISSRKNA